VLVSLCVGALALAAPTPVEEGDIGSVKSKDFIPTPSKADGYQPGRPHPAVVVSNPNDKDRVKVAVISHSHPGDPPQKPATDYAAFGEGSGSINVGPPRVIKAKDVKLFTQDPKKLEADKLASLKAEINKNCADGQKLSRRDGSCKMKSKKTPAVPKSKKAPAVANKKSTATRGKASPARKVGGVRKSAVKSKKQAKPVGGARKPAKAAPKKKPVGNNKAGRKPAVQPKKQAKAAGAAKKPTKPTPKKPVGPGKAGRK